MKLTTEQKEVVSVDPATRLLVEAVPGSGKTEVLAWRLARLLRDGMGPAQIMVLSFSNAAVRTLVSRLRKVAHSQQDVVDDLRHISVRTFDSWAFRLLTASGKHQLDLLRSSYEENIIAATEVVRSRDGIKSILAGVRHVFIDEVQDLTGARSELAIELLKYLSGPAAESPAGFTLLGDRNQGIYGFSAPSDGSPSTPEFIDMVGVEWDESLEHKALTINHRLGKELLASSGKARKALEAARGAKALAEIRKIVESFPVADSAVEEASGANAILCRTNAQALVVASDIWGKGDSVEGPFPYLNAGDQQKLAPAWIGRILSQAVDAQQLTRDLFIRAYDQLLSVQDRKTIPNASEAWVFLQKCLKSSPDSQNIDLDRLRERLTWTDFLPDDESAPPENSLEITTIHQSKGREYDNVILLGTSLESPDSTDEELREEARIIYVGITRSKRFVKVWMPNKNMDMYAKKLWKSRTRLMRIYAGGVIIEGGLRRDINPASFVTESLLGINPDETQQYLWNNRNALVGRKVVLVKEGAGSNQSHYRIFLQEDGEPSTVLGSMTDLFREEVLGAYKQSAKRYSLPSRIYNLRIASVCTYSAKLDDVDGASHPWSASGFWLGVNLTGLAFFKTYKQNAK